MPKETVLDSIFDDRDQGLLAKRSEYEKEIEYEIKMDGNEEKLRKFIDSIYNQKLKNKKQFIGINFRRYAKKRKCKFR